MAADLIYRRFKLILLSWSSGGGREGDDHGQTINSTYICIYVDFAVLWNHPGVVRMLLRQLLLTKMML